MGGDNVTEAVSERLGVPFDQADRGQAAARHVAGPRRGRRRPPGGARRSRPPPAPSSKRSAARSTTTSRSRASVPLQRIVLSGGGARLGGLGPATCRGNSASGRAGRRHRRRCKIGKTGLSDRATELRRAADRSAGRARAGGGFVTTQTVQTAGVAAMPRVNLMPPEIAEAERFRRLQLAMGGAVLLAAVSSAASTMHAKSGITVGAAQVTTAQAQNTALQTKLNSLASVKHDLRRRCRPSSSCFSRRWARRSAGRTSCNDLSLRIPNNVWLTGMTATETSVPGVARERLARPAAAWRKHLDIGTMTFSGVAFKHDDVANWLDSLATEQGLHPPDLPSSTKTAIGTTTVVVFVIARSSSTPTALSPTDTPRRRAAEMTKTRQWTVLTAIAVIVVLACRLVAAGQAAELARSPLQGSGGDPAARPTACCIQEIAALQAEKRQLAAPAARLQKFATQVPTAPAEPAIIRRCSRQRPAPEST